ncbi:secreted hydrolase-like protein [Magnetococcus marinus MC-1]|uniref:Secreted hydrolase-like protein n=1 Tax=Magnetococcus marinus (strain ATCC BAA-1437 / JCM 17883 / MC-1) TaxID=156889 RepID=A0L815_MAGMM|nr:carotenoid biosynthesis protein [Magnetococcus marinus]ABK44108.1 secreted hydrolase-like protein [Magnetococcus marinus MC-1]
MESLFGSASPAFILIQLVNYTIAVILLIYSFRTDRQLFWTLVAGILMGFAIEYSQTSKVDPPYYYSEALVWLPGGVPLGVVLSWGTIFFSLFTTLRRLELSLWVMAPLAGFTATVLDLVTDPAFVSIGFWVWKVPPGWYGIPWSNYMGWYIIVAAFVASTQWMLKHFKPGQAGLFWEIVRAVLPVPITFVAFIGLMTAYVYLFQEHHWVPEQLVVGALLLLTGWLAAWQLRRADRSWPVNAFSLVTPIFLIITSLLILVLSPLHTTYPTLAVVMPALSALVLLVYLSPYLDVLLGRVHPAEPCEKCAHITWWAILATLLMVVSLYFGYLAPKRGLIGPVEIPQNDAFLPNEQVQWWYWTGHLKTESGREFGYEVVFFAFKTGLLMRDQLIQAAITDVEGQKFHFGQKVVLKLPEILDSKFDLTTQDGLKTGNIVVTAKGGGGLDHLHAEVDGYVLDAELKETKPVALHYGGDAHPYRFQGYTYYYSRPHMETTGTLSYQGKTEKITGTTWFDRQYGELYQAIVKGWQWFAIELEDNRQIMIYDILGNANEVERAGSLTGADGITRAISRFDFDVEILGEWTSPHTKCTYPSGWKVTVGDEVFTILPQVKDQELRAVHGYWAGPEYWEGTNTVTSDKVNGRAYVELNGYCRGIEGTWGIRNKKK